ncbi:hypothetical protein K3495_g2151 [Podosphaera aphanis]|nr:hypothetical protein K3495_g2151 [Podosphaera aphanis]
MAPDVQRLTEQVKSGSPYQLNSNQVLKASEALLKHIRTTAAGKLEKAALLEESPLDTYPIWLQLTTKVHITEEKRLKPIKITLPHPLNDLPTTTICLITADPQRSAKDLIASPAFPAEIATRITRVVGLSKLKAKWSQYEAQRKLFSEHDIFLADDRIVTSLPGILGKTFFKTTSKRPIPISIQQPPPVIDGKRQKKVKGDQPRGLADVKVVAKEIQKATQSAVVYLSSSTNTAVRVGYANWSAEKLQQNIEALANALIERAAPKKWRGVKSLHIKGAETISLPIWLAEEMWLDEKDILSENQKHAKSEEKIVKKRKARGLDDTEATDKKEPKESKKKPKKKVKTGITDV